MRCRWCWVVTLAGCGGVPAIQDAGPADAGPVDAGQVDGGPEDGGSDAGSDGGPTRTVWLSATGVQAFTVDAPSIFQQTPADLATDVDAVTVFGEFYGVPWAGFASDAGPTGPWVSTMQGLAATIRTLQRPIFLSLTIGRDGLTNDVVLEDGGYTTRSGWAPCYDFSADGGSVTKEAYLSYVRWMMAAFQPRWVNVAVEINLYGLNCPAQWPGVADAVGAAYAAAKGSDPSVVAFESFALDGLYGLSDCASTPDACFNANYAQIPSLPRDRFGVSAYPRDDPALLPADYFVRGAHRNPQGPERVVIAETGYNSASIVVGDGVNPGSCVELLTSTEARAAAYLSRVFSDAQAQGFELVDWWSDRNLLPEPLMSGCPCSYSADWCAIESVFQSLGGLQGDLLFKAFGAMGLRSYDGAPKSQLLATWQTFQSLPRRDP